MAKKLLFLMFLVTGATSPALSAAQGEIHSDIPQVVIESLAEEPPLSQADLDAYIKIMPELTRILSDPQSAEQLAVSLNLSPIRFSYIVAKVPLAMALTYGADPKSLGLDSLPKVLYPSDKELRLVKNNLDSLVKSAEEVILDLTEALPGVTAQ